MKVCRQCWTDTPSSCRKEAWHYLSTYAATALGYERSAAQEGSLHEGEFISPATRDGKVINLVGYIFEQEVYPLLWKEKETLNRLQFSGERTYC